MSQGGAAEGIENLDERIDQLSRVVDLFVDKVEADFGVSLDYGPGSVRYVDAILAESHDSREALAPGLFLSVGGYLGEILVRNYDGEWVEDGENLAVTVPGQAHAQTLPIFDWVKAAWSNPREESLGARLDRVVGDGLGSSTPGLA